MLATGTAGPRRLRYGTPRDLVIGITVVRPAGTVAKSGGKVVKNVAGYDLGKLYAGSYGTLGLITEAVFRLHPLPAAAAFVTAGYADTAAASRRSRPRPALDLAPVGGGDRPAGPGRPGPGGGAAGGRPGRGGRAGRAAARRARRGHRQLGQRPAVVGAARPGW